MRIESSNCSLTYFIKSFRTLNGNFYSVELVHLNRYKTKNALKHTF